MAAQNQDPFLIAGGGIGGLAAAYALARKGFPVRVLEQAPEFKEIGAGIQLGPNIFRALDKIGLRDAVLADAHRPPAMEMRCALSGDLVTRIPLDDKRFLDRFQHPYAVTHRADIHGAILNACLERQPGDAGNTADRRDLRAGRRRRHRGPAIRRAGPRPRADRLRRHVVENPRQHRGRRQAAGLGPYRLPRRAQEGRGAG